MTRKHPHIRTCERARDHDHANVMTEDPTQADDLCLTTSDDIAIS